MRRCTSCLVVSLGLVFIFMPAFAEDDWCGRVAGGPSGAQTLPVDLSTAHAAIRFFGTATTTAESDLALAVALDPPDALEKSGTTMLQAYAGRLRDVCLVATDNRPVGPARVEMVGRVALVHPGTGAVVIPSEAAAVAIDLRGLANASGLRAALEAAVAPALATPVPRAERRIREHEGMSSDIVLEYDVYYDAIESLTSPPIPGAGARLLPLALLTGGRMTPDAVELAMTLRLAGRALVVGDDLFAAIAESRWQGIGSRDVSFGPRGSEDPPGRRRALGMWGLAYRTADLASAGTRWPDRIPADVPTADPVAALASLQAWPPPAPIGAGAALRPEIRTREPGTEGEPAQGALGDARAALIALHGAVRLFLPTLDELGSSPEAGRAALDARFLEVLGAIGDAAPDGAGRVIRHLRRFMEVMQDGGAAVGAFPFTAAPHALPLFVERIGNLPVVQRSLVPEIMPGDTIVSVDGRSAGARYADEEALTSAATEWHRFVRATRGAILNQEAPVSVGLRDPSGATRAVIATPAPASVLASLGSGPSTRLEGPLTDLGAPELYYFNLAADVTPDQYPHAVNARGAAGVILDIRGQGFNPYGSAIAFTCQPFLSPVFETPVVGDGLDEPPELFQYHFDYRQPTQFCGPIVLLIDSRSVGSTETFATMMQDAHRARIVGRTSAGSSANSALMLLPGGLQAAFGGLESLHADGRRFHGVGIVPHVVVEPQAADFAAGFDRTLDAGIRELRALIASPCPADPDQDADGDGRCGDVDNCRETANADQADRDGDGLGDACDPCRDDPGNDADHDGTCAGDDNCPAHPNPGQENADGDPFGDACDNCPAVASNDPRDSDGDGLGDACDLCPLDHDNDADHDGVCGDRDNCPVAPNPAQTDSDGDGSGDACDPCPQFAGNDPDRDGVCEDLDDCPGAANPGQADADGDGRGDACDVCPHASDPGQEDANGDGAGDACQPSVEIVSILEDGGTTLEVTARAADPQGEAIHGTIRIVDTTDSFILEDFVTQPDCGALLAPERLAGRGIAFARSGSLGYLADADFLSGLILGAPCEDGQPDYTIAPGSCASPTFPADIVLDLSLAGSAVPGPICIERIDGSARFDFHLERDGDGWRLEGATPPALETTYQGSGLPAEVALPQMTAGHVYRLEVTATDGATPELRATRDFLYQGESVLQFLAPQMLRPRPRRDVPPVTLHPAGGP